MTRRLACAVCEETSLDAIEGFDALPRVTSDCKPFAAGGRLAVCVRCGAIQKLADEKWRADSARIYADYEIYRHSDGAEQPIFTPCGPAPRSRMLVNFLINEIALPPRGRLIDIGCGNGAALANFAAALPEWRLYGNELSDFALASLSRLPNFATLYTCGTSEIPGRYDLVSMIHALEHMPSPRATLFDISRLLADDGRVFIEVPDVETSPFDLLVADHRTHFTRSTLSYLAASMGYETDFIGNTLLPKEITLVARRGVARKVLPDAAAGRAIAQTATRWLADVLAAATTAAEHQPFGVFGSSVSAMWLFGALRERISFFVDEDPARIGRQCEGRPILGPRDAPAEAKVFVPLIPEIAARVVNRYRDAGARFVTSPVQPK